MNKHNEKSKSEGMEKYAVDEQSEPLEKVASKGCPSCGVPPSSLLKYGSVISCPNCGTEPFERPRKTR